MASFSKRRNGGMNGSGTGSTPVRRLGTRVFPRLGCGTEINDEEIEKVLAAMVEAPFGFFEVVIEVSQRTPRSFARRSLA